MMYDEAAGVSHVKSMVYAKHKPPVKAPVRSNKAVMYVTLS